MAQRPSRVDRRGFVRTAVALGAGAAALGSLPRQAVGAAGGDYRGRPVIITSHTNETGHEALSQAWPILESGGRAMDAVERGANVIEVDPEDHSGLPNLDGVVQLDASCMDGRTYNAGSVGAIEGIKTPSSVARLVMERTDHVMIVGRAATEFAKSFGFAEEDLMTPESREIWLRWRENHDPADFWGPPEHLRGNGSDAPSDALRDRTIQYEHGTTNVLAVDANGDIAGITTTSGYSWKLPGRVGDSPIIGAGLYVDNSVGAAGATGRGEDVIKSCASYFIVMRMREGRTPQQACEDAVEMIVDRYRAIGNDYVPGEKFVAIDKSGEYGCASMGSGDGAPRLTVRHADALEVYAGAALYPSRS